MDFPVEEQWASVLRNLQNEEESLEAEVRYDERTYSGLKNIDSVLRLARVKLDMALEILDILAANNTPRKESLKEMAQQRARDAVLLMEELLSAAVSLDQKGVLTDSPLYTETQGRLQELLMRGGAGYFEEKILDARNAESLARIVTSSIEKYLNPDDNYQSLFKTEKLPSFFRRFMNLFFSSIAPENQKDPPYGIEEGEELWYESERMRMPLSQAILYLEEELLPELEKRLRESPGDPGLQREMQSAEAKIDELRKLRFIPRSTPVVIEKGFYTDWFSGYTTDGELLIAIELPVRFRSGTNLERMQELVQAEVARRAAGKGICPELDREYQYIKSLESGLKGSSRLPGFKLATRRCFRILKCRFPALRGLEDKEEFKKLVEMVRLQGRRSVQKLVTKNLMRRTQGQRFLQ